MCSSVAEDLRAISEIAHCLKGSSAALGLIKVQDSCAMIQYLGEGLDPVEPDQRTITDSKELLTRIQQTLDYLKAEYESVAKSLRMFYESDSGEESSKNNERH